MQAVSWKVRSEVVHAHRVDAWSKLNIPSSERASNLLLDAILASLIIVSIQTLGEQSIFANHAKAEPPGRRSSSNQREVTTSLWPVQINIAQSLCLLTFTYLPMDLRGHQGPSPMCSHTSRPSPRGDPQFTMFPSESLMAVPHIAANT